MSLSVAVVLIQFLRFSPVYSRCTLVVQSVIKPRFWCARGALFDYALYNTLTDRSSLTAHRRTAPPPLRRIAVPA